MDKTKQFKHMITIVTFTDDSLELLPPKSSGHTLAVCPCSSQVGAGGSAPNYSRTSMNYMSMWDTGIPFCGALFEQEFMGQLTPQPFTDVTWMLSVTMRNVSVRYLCRYVRF